MPASRTSNRARVRGARRAADAAPRVLLGCPADVAAIVRPLMRSHQETFVALAINVRNVLIGEPQIIAIGTLTCVEVHPRDVFRFAITTGAAGIVVAHNHPSGDPTPSAEDLTLTERLIEAGKLLGIPVIDHVVVTDTSHASIAAANAAPNQEHHGKRWREVFARGAGEALGVDPEMFDLDVDLRTMSRQVEDAVRAWLDKSGQAIVLRAIGVL